MTDPIYSNKTPLLLCTMSTNYIISFRQGMPGIIISDSHTAACAVDHTREIALDLTAECGALAAN